MKRRRLLIGLLTGLGAILALPGPARGELILDDFDDPATVESPSMLNESNFAEVVTENVGILQARRRLALGATATRPVAHIDSNVTNASRLSASLTSLNRTNALTPLVGISFDYRFSSPTDVTEGGVNDAIYFDFRQMSGSYRPRFLRALVSEGSRNTYQAEIDLRNFPLSASPFSLRMPRSLFTVRGGAPGTPDFTTMASMNFDFFFLGGDDPVEWSMQLERLRVAPVPEPSALGLAALGGIGVWGARRRRSARRPR